MRFRSEDKKGRVRIGATRAERRSLEDVEAAGSVAAECSHRKLQHRSGEHRTTICAYVIARSLAGCVYRSQMLEVGAVHLKDLEISNELFAS